MMLWRKQGLYMVSCVVLAWASVVYAVDKVDINTADALTLAHVMEGIGEKKAEAIVKYRQEEKNQSKPSSIIRLGLSGQIQIIRE